MPRNQPWHVASRSRDGKRIAVVGPGIELWVDNDDVDHGMVELELERMLAVLNKHASARIPEPGCGATNAVLLIERDGLYAALRSPKHNGLITLVGGRIEPGESPRHAALREAAEECGVDAGVVRYLGRWLANGELTAGFVADPLHLYFPRGGLRSGPEGEAFWATEAALCSLATAKFPVWNCCAFSAYRALRGGSKDRG